MGVHVSDKQMGILLVANLWFTIAFIYFQEINAIIEEREIANVSEIQERTFDEQPNPDQLPSEVEITAFGEVHKLKLIPNSPIFAPDLKEDIITIDENGDIDIVPANNTNHNHQEIDKHLFTDETGLASFHIEKKDGILHFEGILKDGIRIESGFTNRTTGEPIHFAYKHQIDNDTLHSCVAIEVNNTTSNDHWNSTLIETRSLPVDVIPEVLLVIDYKISSYFNFNLDEIKRYLGVFYNSVNRRFSTIPTPNIRVAITGIIITPSANVERFITTTIPDVADSKGTLDKFGSWLYHKRHSIRAYYDVAFWLTGFTLGGWDNFQYETTQQGVAYVGCACQIIGNKNFNVAIGRDSPGKYTGVHTSAHEIAHLLGAAHDGEKVNNPPGNPGAKECPWAQGYIMSYEFGTPNKFFFSPCSIREIQYTIQSPQAACLLNNPSEVKVNLDSTLPGQIVSLDNQCKTAHGDDTVFYKQKLLEVCLKRWCARDRWIIVSLMTNGPALEGSPCGYQMICINGACVPSRY